MNVLLIGGGRRTELAWRFIERGYSVYAYELDRRVPIAYVARIIEGYSWDDVQIVHHLIETIEENDINLVLPLMDAATPICALLPETPDCKIVVSNGTTASKCFDKEKFRDFMLQYFRDIYPADSAHFPKIAKPRFGCGSRDIVIIKNRDEYARFSLDNRLCDYVIQQLIIGTEYSVDAYFDANCKYVDSIPRERIRTCGEVITSKIVPRPSAEIFQYWAELVGEKLKIKGPCNMQFKMCDMTNYLYLFEVNARFGGGWTFSMEAGLDAISLIERDFFGRDFEYTPNQWKDNLLLERSYEDHYFETT